MTQPYFYINVAEHDDEVEMGRWSRNRVLAYLADRGPRPSLLPGADDADGWWTCHKDTRMGDLALMYRKTISDIAYLFSTTTDARSIRDPDLLWRGWGWECDYEPLAAFRNPLSLEDMQRDPGLVEWSPLNGNFHRQVFRIQSAHWECLTTLLARQNAGFRETVADHLALPLPKRLSEAQVQSRLAANPRLLRQAGYNLELHQDAELTDTGTEVRCWGHDARIDLLCRDRSDGAFVVVELKVVPADRTTLAQVLGYMGWVRDELAHGAPVRGLVISRGAAPGFYSSLAFCRNVEQVDLERVIPNA
ncbi:MAG: hypothetical protein HYU66_14560 [Armatimonadetes bacterium]|nr:hypothetical protein [Armatimonadota bacterium]